MKQLDHPNIGELISPVKRFFVVLFLKRSIIFVAYLNRAYSSGQQT